MTEIFITNIQNKVQADKVLNSIKTENTDMKINFDFNQAEKAYPCGHTILRIESAKINTESILTSVKDLGYSCEILEDKICI